MSQTNPTPAWGTPAGTNPAAETQVLPPVSAVPPRGPAGPTRGEVELRVTALHYANKMLGERGTAAPDTHVSATLRAAKQLERYLLSGDPSGI